MSKNYGLFMLMLLLSVVLVACGSDEESSSSSEDNVLKVGLEAGYAPFNWTQSDDSNGAVAIEGSKEFAGGYDVEIAKKVADKLGKELVIVKTEWDGLVPALQSNVIDVIIAGMSPTEERKEAIDFSDTYYVSDFVIVTKAGSEYANAKTLADFEGAKITAQLNTSNYDVIDQIPNVDKQTAMDNFPAMRVAIESGVIDGYVAERPEAISAAAANENFAYVELEDGFDVEESQISVAIGVRKGDENLAAMNEALAEISEEDRQTLMEQAIANQPAAQ